jgi:23S rRNA (cytosine1962-C5)-methyltransferase
MLELLRAALDRRTELMDRLHAEDTTCYRVLHGAAEGLPGLTVDRYGPVLLLQTWREPLEVGLLPELGALVSRAVGVELVPVWNHRGKPRRPFAEHHPVELPEELWGSELGLRYDVRPRHRGQDPLLFLDLRVLRRRVRERAGGASVLNLFSYTCGVGLCAAAGGAREVLNVDFAQSALSVGQRNAAANGLHMDTLELDALATMRRFAGIREGRRRLQADLSPRAFELVVLDPPAWSKGPFGAVDVIRDYPGLFKPALLCASPGGVVAATHHVPSVSREEWVRTLSRTAVKAGRPLKDIEILTPEADFPSFDGEPPTKIAWCTVGG